MTGQEDQKSDWLLKTIFTTLVTIALAFAGLSYTNLQSKITEMSIKDKEIIECIRSGNEKLSNCMASMDKRVANLEFLICLPYMEREKFFHKPIPDLRHKENHPGD